MALVLRRPGGLSTVRMLKSQQMLEAAERTPLEALRCGEASTDLIGNLLPGESRQTKFNDGPLFVSELIKQLPQLPQVLVEYRLMLRRWLVIWQIPTVGHFELGSGLPDDIDHNVVSNGEEPASE